MNACRCKYGEGVWWLGGIGLSLCLLFLTAASAQDKGKPSGQQEAPTTKALPRVPIVEVIPSPQKKDPPITAVIPLSAPDADQITNSLGAMFGNYKTSGLYLEYFPHRKALLLRGSAEQIHEVKLVLKALGEPEPKVGGGGVRVLTLDKGSAATVAEAIQRMLNTLRPGNPAKVVLPGDKLFPKKEPAKKAEKPLPDAKGRGVLLTAIGNKLIVATEDPQLMELVVELVRMLQEPIPINDFQAISLKYARAVSVARVLEEAFNGPKLGKGGSSGMERIRVVADPATNILLLKANPLDMLTIHNLVERVLDVATVEKGGEQPPKGKK